MSKYKYVRLYATTNEMTLQERLVFSFLLYRAKNKKESKQTGTVPMLVKFTKLGKDTVNKILDKLSTQNLVFRKIATKRKHLWSVVDKTPDFLKVIKKDDQEIYQHTKIYAAPELNYSEQLVWSMLYSLQDRHRFKRTAILAKMSGVHYTTALRAIRSLQGKGLLSDDEAQNPRKALIVDGYFKKPKTKRKRKVKMVAKPRNKNHEVYDVSPLGQILKKFPEQMRKLDEFYRGRYPMYLIDPDTNSIVNDLCATTLYLGSQDVLSQKELNQFHQACKTAGNVEAMLPEKVEELVKRHRSNGYRNSPIKVLLKVLNS